MVAPVGFGFIGMLAMFFGGAGMPVSLPPLPADPVLAKAAPEKCLWYYSWAGMAKADPSSKNQTEQLIAEDEVQRFVGQLSDRLTAAFRKGAPHNREGVVVGEEAPKLVKAFLTRPMALFISKFGMGPDGPTIEGGMIVNAGEQALELQKSLENIEAVMLPGGKPGAEKAAPEKGTADSKWHVLPTPPGAPVVEWGFRGKYFIVGVGKDSADAIIARAKGTAVPAWLTDLKKRLPVERPATIHYLNLKSVLELALPFGGPPAKSIVDALGVSGVQYYGSVSGLDANGSLSKSLLALDEEATGLLSTIGGKPLTAADLAPIPADANLAFVVRLDADKLFHRILDTIGKIAPDESVQMLKGMHEVEEHLGVQFSEDIFQSLGDTWCVYNSPVDGGLLFTGLTLVVPVRDYDKLVTAHDKLVRLIRQEMGPEPPASPGGRRQRGVTIKEVTISKQKIYFLNFIGAESPFAPAWCITDKYLVVSLFPQGIKAHLSRPADAPSLAKNPAVAAALADQPLALAYQDSQDLFRTAYPYLQILAQLGCSELQREGLDIDISMLPSARDISKHLGADVTTFARDKDGFLITQKGSLPVSVSTPALLLPVFAFGFVRSERMEMRPVPPPEATRTTERKEETRPEPVEEPRLKEESKPEIQPKPLRPGVKPAQAPQINLLRKDSKVQFAAFGNTEAKSAAQVTLVADSTDVKPAAAPAVAPSKIHFHRTVLDTKFRSEGVAVGDFNKDGKNDIVAGSVWYEAPDWKPHPLLEKANEFDPHGYSDSFCNFVMDVNHDGWPDVIEVDFPGKQTWWFENPKETGKPWTRHELTPVTNDESPMLVEIRPGEKALVCGVAPGKMAYLTPDKDDPNKPWIIHPIAGDGSPGIDKFTHGVGVGDINGDKRNDILMTQGWWEAPADDTVPWKFHPANFGQNCAQMHVYDFNGDGLNDVLTSSAHDAGIWWHEQLKDGGWKTHEIDKSFSQSHSLVMVDINGDGLPDFVTGKRFWAHGPGGDKNPGDPAVLMWFDLSRKDGQPEWTPHEIDHDSGVGTQFEVADVNGDGLLDVVISNKKGTFYFEQYRD